MSEIATQTLLIETCSGSSQTETTQLLCKQTQTTSKQSKVDITTQTGCYDKTKKMCLQNQNDALKSESTKRKPNEGNVNRRNIMTQTNKKMLGKVRNKCVQTNTKHVRSSENVAKELEVGQKQKTDTREFSDIVTIDRKMSFPVVGSCTGESEIRFGKRLGTDIRYSRSDCSLNVSREYKLKHNLHSRTNGEIVTAVSIDSAPTDNHLQRDIRVSYNSGDAKQHGDSSLEATKRVCVTQRKNVSVGGESQLFIPFGEPQTTDIASDAMQAGTLNNQ